MGYLPGLDGVRAIAVLAVMGYHLQAPGLSGGFLGVDTFFVLSGFLITSLLLQEQARSGRTNLIAFWGRRARRLFPGLFAMVAAVCVYALFAAPLMQQTIRGQGLATIFYVNNWWIIASGGSYFQQFQSPSPLLHTWSLGVEEQWYLVFPVLLAGALAWRVRRDARLAALLGLIAVASTVWTAWLASNGASADRLYLGTETRMQELLVGAALAAAVHVAAQRGRALASGRALQIVGAICAVAVVAAFIVISDTDRFLFYGGMLVFSLLVAGIILALVDPGGGRLGKVFGHPVLRTIGLWSYSLYLWHWPVYVILTPATAGVTGPVLGVSKVLLTFVLAAGSYYLLESPIRHGWLRDKFGGQGQLAVAVLAAAVLVAGVLVTTQSGVKAVAAATDYVPASSSDYAGTGPKVFLMGDSVPYLLREDVDQRTLGALSVAGSSELGCTVFPATFVIGSSEEESWPKCYQWAADRGDILAQASPDVALIFPGQYQLFDIRQGGTTIDFATPEYAAWLDGQLAALVDQTSGNAAHVAIVTVPCYSVYDDGNNSKARFVNDRGRIDWLNGRLRAFAASNGLEVVDMNRWSCGDGRNPEEVDGVKMRTDGLHYSREGAAIVWQWLEGEVARIMGTPGPAATASPTGTPTPSPTAAG